MIKELKNCPFCGGKAEHDNSENGMEWIECTECGATQRQHSISSSYDVYIEWNKRKCQSEVK